MSLMGDLRVLHGLLSGSRGGRSHTERLENFYGRQAQDYDDFRKRLLHGRRDLLERISFPEQAVWVDMGGGTGANVEALGEARLARLSQVYIVDLCEPLLDVARERIRAKGWGNVEAVCADATSFVPREGWADVVTFSYSLTMIPEWFDAVDHASRLLSAGGQVGVVDFHVARKHPAAGSAKHSWLTRTFWPTWFGFDDVFPSPDHLPYLMSRFDRCQVSEHRGRVPYLPLWRVPYFIFVGNKTGAVGVED